MTCVTWCDYTGEFDKTDPNSRQVTWSVSIGTFSAWFENEILGVVSGEAPTIPDQLYLAFHSTASTINSAGIELSGGNYFRIPFALESASAIQLRNPQTIVSQLASEDWEGILSATIWDAASGGNYYGFGNLFEQLVIPAGRGVQIIPRGLTVGIATQADNGFSNWFIDKSLRILLGEAPTLPVQMSIAALSSASTAVSPGTELSGNGYSRTPVTLTQWTLQRRANADRVMSATATADWNEIVSCALFDEVGNYYSWSNGYSGDIDSGESIEWESYDIVLSLGNIDASDPGDALVGFDQGGPVRVRDKFQPDPLPQGMPEQWRNWMQTQFTRAADLWPDPNLERRIAALEEGQVYASGVLPIVDSSGMSCLGDPITAGALRCGPITVLDDTIVKNSSITAVGYTSITGSYFISQNRGLNPNPSLFEVDSGGNVIQRVVGSAVRSSLVGSQSGTINVGDRVFWTIDFAPFGRVMYGYDPDGWTKEEEKIIANGTNVQFICESKTYLRSKSNTVSGTNFESYAKSNFDKTTVTEPAGFRETEVGTWTTTDDKSLVALEEIATGRFYIYSWTGASTLTQLEAFDADYENVNACVTVGSFVYWLVAETSGAVTLNRIVKTNFDGERQWESEFLTDVVTFGGTRYIDAFIVSTTGVEVAVRSDNIMYICDTATGAIRTCVYTKPIGSPPYVSLNFSPMWATDGAGEALLMDVSLGGTDQLFATAEVE